MTQKNPAAGRADQVYRIGPETLVASSRTVAIGRVSNYSRQILKATQPGPHGLPLQWKVTGAVADPVILKGTELRGPVHFARTERAFMDPGAIPDPLWMQQFGEIGPDGEVLLFFTGTDASDPAAVLPAGSGDHNLATLVRATIAIQRVTDSRERFEKWLAFLKAGPSPEGYRTALRSLAHSGAKWGDLEPTFKKILLHSTDKPEIQAFTFALIAFQIAQNTWGDTSTAALDLLCASFASQADPDLALQDLEGLAVVLNYSSQEPPQKSLHVLRETTVSCLRKWASLGFANDTLAEEYQRLRRQYAIQ